MSAPSDARDDEPREDAEAEADVTQAGPEAAGDADASEAPAGEAGKGAVAEGEAKGGEPAASLPAEGEATPPAAKRRRPRRSAKAKQAGGEEAAPAAPTAEKTAAGKSVAQARAILAFTPREVARDWSKLLESAVANAENNHELLADDLIIREAYADEGPTIKRFRPRAMGRATPIRKRTSHLTITLTARPDTTKRAS